MLNQKLEESLPPIFSGISLLAHLQDLGLYLFGSVRQLNALPRARLLTCLSPAPNRYPAPLRIRRYLHYTRLRIIPRPVHSRQPHLPGAGRNSGQVQTQQQTVRHRRLRLIETGPLLAVG